MFVKPGKLFPSLEFDSQDDFVLRQTSNYYYQIQKQLYISKRKYCYFFIHTLYIQGHGDSNDDNSEGSLTPKLTLFYEKYLRPLYSGSLLIQNKIAH
jgi:hypothetical protein